MAERLSLEEAYDAIVLHLDERDRPPEYLLGIAMQAIVTALHTDDCHNIGAKEDDHE